MKAAGGCAHCASQELSLSSEPNEDETKVVSPSAPRFVSDGIKRRRIAGGSIQVSPRSSVASDAAATRSPVSVPALGGDESELDEPAVVSSAADGMGVGSSASVDVEGKDQMGSVPAADLPEGYDRMPRLWRTIPVGSRAFFLSLARRHCIAFEHAYTDCNERAGELIESMEKFLGLIRQTMTRPRGGQRNSGRGVISKLNERLVAAAAGDAAVVGMAVPAPASPVLSVLSAARAVGDSDSDSVASVGHSQSEAALSSRVELKSKSSDQNSDSKNEYKSDKDEKRSVSEAKRPMAREAAFAAIVQDGIRRADAPAQADARAVKRLSRSYAAAFGTTFSARLKHLCRIRLMLCWIIRRKSKCQRCIQCRNAELKKSTIRRRDAGIHNCRQYCTAQSDCARSG
jgi:hypothetical protein